MKRTDFLRGLRNSMPIVLGYMPVCLTFGAVGVGMQLDRMLIMSLSVVLYAGAGQFAAIQLFSAGAGALVTIATVILINLRYALLAESFKSRRQVQSFFSKIVVGPLLTEEVYAVAMYGEKKTTSPQSTAYILGLQIPPYVATAVFTATGISAGSIEVFSPDAFVEGEDDQGCGGDRGDGSGIEGDVLEGLEVLDQGVGPLGGSPH